MDLVEQRRVPPTWNTNGMLLVGQKANAPDVWLGNVGLPGHSSDSSPFEDAIERFVPAALRQLEDRPDNERIYGWPKRRLAINMLGSGQGGGSLRKGNLAQGLLRVLYRLAEERDVDLVFVLYGEKPYAAAQWARRQLAASSGIAALWSFDDTANPALFDKAKQLAREAISSQLVLFIGAGVSAGAGLPDWKTLLQDVAVDAGLDAQTSELLRTYDLRDQATIVESRLRAGDTALRELVAARLKVFRHYALAHGLLASLPSREAVTTNFDDLFELASSVDSRDIAVLPDNPRDARGRWLLKLHGGIERPESIVLTRSDYLDMPRRFGAFMGLVQGLLMMRHMMFVGYSLSDEDFHELVHEVRIARRGVISNRKAGTVLTLSNNPIALELWSRELDIVPMMKPEVDVEIPVAAKQLEIFLDLVGFLSTTTAAFFLDDEYVELTTDESALRRSVAALVPMVHDAEPGTVAHSVRAFLDTLGGVTTR